MNVETLNRHLSYVEHCKHKPAGSHALVSLLEGRRWRHGFESRLVDSGCDLLPIRPVYYQHHPGEKVMLDKQSLLLHLLLHCIFTY